MTAETDPLGQVTTYAYDAVGNRTLVVNARGQSVTSSFDGDNRLVGKAYPGGRLETFTYERARGGQAQISQTKIEPDPKKEKAATGAARGSSPARTRT